MQASFDEYPFVNISYYTDISTVSFLMFVQLTLAQKESVRKTPAGGMLLSLLAWPLDPQRMEDERRKHSVSLGTSISCSL